MKEQGNILFSGVGGQGILLASELTALSLLTMGLDVKKSEVHGMAQRGGSVVAHLRYGKKVYSPLISPGEADISVSFEMMEAVRYLPFLHAKSKVIVNIYKILPPSVALGKTDYPENVLDELTSRGLEVLSLDAFALASDIGEIRAANVVMVGVLSTMLPIPEEVFLDVIKKRVPERFLEVNTKAFLAGRKVGAA